MIIINNGTNPFSHKGFVLPKGQKMDVPDALAKEFLKIKGVEKYIAPKDLEKAAKEAEEKAAAEIQALKDENKELKKQVEKLTKDLEKAAKEAEKKSE